MELQGKKIAVLVDNMYQEMEVWYPYFRFKEAGAEVFAVGAEAGKTYTSKLGYPIVADKSYDQVKAADFDGVVAPGGFAPDLIRRHSKAIQFVKELNAQGKLVASICHEQERLCSSQVARSSQATQAPPAGEAAWSMHLTPFQALGLALTAEPLTSAEKYTSVPRMRSTGRLMLVTWPVGLIPAGTLM